MLETKYLLAPFISSFIGWITNYIAVKMLFHPKKPIKILFFTIQGIFPKRKKELAENLGDIVEKELVSHNDINQVIENPELHGDIKNTVEDYFVKFIKDKAGEINPMLPMFLNDEILNKIKRLVGEEFELFLPEIIGRITSAMEDDLNFKEIVKEKVEAFSMEKLEDILFTIMKKEFKFIELTGAVLGFVIGVVQSCIIYFL